MPFRYPVSLDVENRRCVVLGGGEVAEQKARGLLEAGAAVTVVAPEVTSGLNQLEARGELAVHRRNYRPGDLDGAFVAIAATDDAEVNALAFAEAERRRVLFNAVDDVSHCHFAAPSVVRRGDFCIAISTGGKAPALAKRVRRELAVRFGPEYEILTEVLADARARAMLTRDVPFAVWARRWQLALERDLVGLVRAGRLDEAGDLVEAILSGSAQQESSEEGRVWIVGAGPGDPELISVRGRRLLEAADVVVYDRLVHPSLIEGKTAVYVGKQAGRPSMTQAEINGLLVALAGEGKDVVRLKGGDPFVFGRGAEEAEALAAAGIRFEIVPGPTSAVAAAAYAGIPVTDRRYASSVAFVTGRTSGRGVDWRALAGAADTIVVLMGLRRIDHIVSELMAGGRDPDSPSAVVSEGTLAEQRVVSTRLADLAEATRVAGVGSPALIVVGDVVSLRERIAWFAPRAPKATLPA